MRLVCVTLGCAFAWRHTSVCLGAKCRVGDPDKYMHTNAVDALNRGNDAVNGSVIVRIMCRLVRVDRCV